jgi:hypothetical protein
MKKKSNTANNIPAVVTAIELFRSGKLPAAFELWAAQHRLLLTRFLKYVNLQNRPEPTSCLGYGPCLLWTGATNKGYAVMSVWGKDKRASHVAYFLAHLVWPKYLCHACDNPLCVAIGHLINGNASFNAYDRAVKKRGGILLP